MEAKLKMNDVVVLAEDLPAKHFETGHPLILRRGQMGTVVMPDCPLSPEKIKRPGVASFRFATLASMTPHPQKCHPCGEHVCYDYIHSAALPDREQIRLRS